MTDSSGLKLSKAVTDAIKQNAASRYPNEACGLIIKKGKKLVPIVCDNIADDPLNRFVISPVEFTTAEDQGEVIAVWHTHVEKSSKPSPADVISCNATELDWFIFDIYREDKGFKFDSMTHLKPSVGIDDLIGREYLYGVNDCFSLATEYYKREFGIEITFVPLGYPQMQISEKEDNNMVQGAIDAGFEMVSSQTPLKGDLFLLNVGSDFPNHIGVYIGDSRMLHHCHNRLSETHIYPKTYWQAHTFAHMRHRELM